MTGFRLSPGNSILVLKPQDVAGFLTSNISSIYSLGVLLIPARLLSSMMMVVVMSVFLGEGGEEVAIVASDRSSCAFWRPKL